MAVHRTKAEALVKWINSLKLSEEIENLTSLQDCVVFINMVCRISGKENASQLIEEKSIEERFQFICNFLECSEIQKNQPDRSRYNPAAGSVVSWQKVLQGEDVELEMAKMSVFLLHLHTLAKQNPREFEALDIDTQGELVGILRYVLDNEEGIHLDNNLATFLRSRASSPVARLFSASSDETNSPIFCGKIGGQKTRFLASNVYSYVPSTSPTSPMRDFMQTPLVQMRRMKKQLSDSRMLRDEMEMELTEARKLITEKETLISIMQQRVERLVKLTERQASEEQPDELGNLREKHESLLNRLRDAQKQCQDLKTEKGQMERKIDQLEEENGDLSYKIRDLGSRLSQSQKALNELMDEHEAAVPLWEGKQKQLESDLHVTQSEKKLMEEKIQILEGKVSLMEDQLKVAGESSSEMKGEVMGDILQLESLKMEVSQLTAKAAELEQESARHTEEKSRLAETVGSLQQSVSELAAQKDALEQAARVQEERLTGQLDALNVEIMKLNNSQLQKDLELEEEKKLRRQLSEDSQSKERAAQQSVLDLRAKLEALGGALKAKEEALCALEREAGAERESASRQMASLKEESERVSGEKASVVARYEMLKAEKEAELEVFTQRVQALECTQLNVEGLARERDQLAQKVQALETEAAEVTSKNQSLQSACEAHQQSHCEEVAALQAELRGAEGDLEEHRNKLAGLDESLRNIEALRRQLASLRGTVEGLEDERKQWEGERAQEAKRLSQLAQEVKGLAEERDQGKARLAEELERRQAAGGQLDEQVARAAKLQSDLSDALRLVGEKEKAEDRRRQDLASWKEKFEAARQKEAEMDATIAGLKEEREKAQSQLLEEKVKSDRLELRIGQLNAEEQGKASALQSDLCDALSRLKEKEALEDKARAEAVSWREKLEAAQKEASRRLSQVEEEAGRSKSEHERVQQELSEARALEQRAKLASGAQEGRISGLEAELAGVRREAGEEGARLGAQVESLRGQLEELGQDRAEAEGERRRLLEEKEGLAAELQAERASKAELEASTEHTLAERQERLAELQRQVSSALAAGEEQEAKERATRGEVEKCWERSGLQQARIAELQAEAAAAKGMKEKVVSQEREMQRYAEVLRKREQELQELGAKLAAGEGASRQHQRAAEAAEEELTASRGLCQERLGAVEALRAQAAELEQRLEGQRGAIARLEAEKTAQGAHSRERAAAQQAELSSLRGALKEKESVERALREKVALHLEDLGRQKDKVRALELEIPTWRLRSAEEQEENAKLQQKAAAEAEAAGELREALEALRAEQASAAQRRDAAAEAANALLQEEVAAQRLTAERLREELAAGRRAEATLESQAQARAQQQRELLQLRGELAEARLAETQRRGELEQRERLLGELRAQAGELPALRARCSEREREVQQLQQSSSHQLEAELTKVREAHAKELAHLTARLAEQESAAGGREEDSRKRAEEATSKYEKAKLKILDDRRKFQEEQQKLNSQVEELQRKHAAENQKIADLNQKLAQHDAAAKSKLQKQKARDSEVKEKFEQQMAELRAQLEKKEEVVQHVKTQLEKAKTHYDSKKMLNLELTEKLETSGKSVSALEQQLATARQEGEDQRAESERLRKEVQQAVREVKEANQKNKTLSAQLDFAARQMRELSASRPTPGPGRPRGNADGSSARATENEADFSKDSIELSDLEETTLSWENTGGRRGKAAYKTPVTANKRAGSLAAQKLRGNQESLESLYFTPLPHHSQSQLDTSLSSLGDLSLDSAKKTRSGRRRTTQVINIVMTKKQTVEYEEPSTSNSSFLSIQSSASHPNLSARRSQGGRRNRPTSVTSLPSSIGRSLSQDSLDSSNIEDLGAAALMNLPGYRPSTRRSTRLSTFGSLTSSSNTLYPGGCQDEPDQLDDWNRIAELQRRNGVCPPHLKTSYPLESNTGTNESIVSEDELRLGDPKETLRRATLLPHHIKELSSSGRQKGQASNPNWKGVTTRQRKRMSEESHQGSDTPEAKKQLTCFPRPLTPKEKDKRGHLLTNQAKRTAQNKAKNQIYLIN
uniref:nuclear mitotic apparatus protein 1-like isoform X4 n=1 Tax=Pristiophorus japonicus TaxID=55135 RepID=UPI00398E5804